MRSLIFIFICAISLADQARARGLLGGLNSPFVAPILDPKLAVVPESQNPAIECPTLNNFGFVNPLYFSHSEIFKALKMKSVTTQELSENGGLQNLRDQFMQATSLFKNNFDLELKSPPGLIQARLRLLSALGYDEKRLNQSMKVELTKLAGEDVRWKSALQKLSCGLQGCKTVSEVIIAYDSLIAAKGFTRDLETALLEQASESISVDEMLAGQVIPSERARLRLFSALLSQLGIQSETRWGCSKTNGTVHFIARLEVRLVNQVWSSDTALSSDFTQKSSQICFSSLAKLSNQCLVTKGAPL